MIELFLCVQLMLSSTFLHASKFSPPGLYDVDHVTLDNGIDVILKPRTGAHTFSVRVWVGVGTQDYPCQQQELPHFLEHLLFTGTSRHTEAELEHMVADHGGYWNAITDVEETIYEMDIYSQNANFAINILHEIITDSTITPENVDISRDIIHREAGGEPSQIRSWFREQGFGINATIKAVLQLVPETNLVCEQLVTATDISREDILSTYEKYYVSKNIALIVVGDFDKQQVLEQIRKTFGTMPEKSSAEKYRSQIKEPSGYDSVTGTFSPIMSDDANIGLMYRLPGYWSEDIYPMMIIEKFLHYKVSEVIRIERGLAYSPDTWSYTTSDFGLFGVYADVDIEDIEDALFLINKEMTKLADKSITEEVLEKHKLKILLQSVQGYESNKDFADYYAGQYVLFKKNRVFENVENNIEAVTVDDIGRVVKKYLDVDKAVTIYETPTLTYTQLYLLLSLLSVIIVMIAFAIYIRVHVRFMANKK